MTFLRPYLCFSSMGQNPKTPFHRVSHQEPLYWIVLFRSVFWYFGSQGIGKVRSLATVSHFLSNVTFLFGLARQFLNVCWRVCLCGQYLLYLRRFSLNPRAPFQYGRNSIISSVLLDIEQKKSRRMGFFMSIQSNF